MLIVIEGSDGSGKSTASKRLANDLKAMWMGFPDRTTPIGHLIDSWLKGEWKVRYNGTLDVPENPADAYANAMVFQALQLANRMEKYRMLDMSRAATVVCDRYWMSSYAYGKADGLDPGHLVDMHHGLPAGDINILMDVDLEQVRERMKARGGSAEAYEQQEAKLTEVIANYRELWHRGAAMDARTWRVVDARGTAEETYEKLMKLVKGVRL